MQIKLFTVSDFKAWSSLKLIYVYNNYNFSTKGDLISVLEDFHCEVFDQHKTCLKSEKAYQPVCEM